MPDSLVSAQPPGRVTHICTQAELNALLTPPNASASSLGDGAPVAQLPARKAGPTQKFISGSEVDFRPLSIVTTGPNLSRVLVAHLQILQSLYERTGMAHGDVAMNTIRLVGEEANAVSYVMNIPEYPWILMKS